MTEPTPPMTPSISMERSGPSDMLLPIQLPNHSTPHSIQSIGYWPKEKVAWNMT